MQLLAVSFQQVDQALCKVDRYFDDHLWVPAALGLFIVAGIVMNFMRKRKEED